MSESPVEGPRTLVEVSHYSGESSVVISATQLGSQYSERRKRQIVDEWAAFFALGPTPIRSLRFVSRTPKRLFDSLVTQTQLTSLEVKWGDYEDLAVLQDLSELETLRLSGASAIQDLRPLAGLSSVRMLQVEGLRGQLDASPVGQMRSVTDLELGGMWTTPRNVHITSAAFLHNMPQLKRLLFHTLTVDDLDYRPLLTLTNLERVRVMAARGMTPNHDELMTRLPWDG